LPEKDETGAPTAAPASATASSGRSQRAPGATGEVREVRIPRRQAGTTYTGQPSH
jgi:hypothetical protein